MYPSGKSQNMGWISVHCRHRRADVVTFSCARPCQAALPRTTHTPPLCVLSCNNALGQLPRSPCRLASQSSSKTLKNSSASSEPGEILLVDSLFILAVRAAGCTVEEFWPWQHFSSPWNTSIFPASRNKTWKLIFSELDLLDACRRITGSSLA